MRLNKTLLNVRVYSPTIGEQAIALLRRKSATVLAFGTAAHDGLTPQNFLLSDGSTGLTAVDGLVGKAKDAIGAIGAIQATAGSRPTLRLGVVNNVLNSKNQQGAAWTAGAFQPIRSDNLLIPSAANSPHNQTQTITTVLGHVTFSFDVRPSGYTRFGFRENTAGGNYIVVDCVGAGTILQSNSITASSVSLVSDGTYRITVEILVSAAAHVFGFYILDNAYTTGSPHTYSYTGNTTSGMYVDAIGMFAGTLTAAQILAAGGIPLTTTAPASSTQGPYWLDTAAGTKTLGSTFPAGNESDIVIDAAKTGATVATAQNLTGAYTINTDTCGRIIIPGTIAAPAVLTAGETALLTAYANRLAGL